MKTATIPSLRVEPELRCAAESVLYARESLSGFVVQSIKENIKRRKLRQAFIERGLTSRDEARLTGEYFEAKDILHALDDMLLDAEGK